jgi:hypothetical protein
MVFGTHQTEALSDWNEAESNSTRFYPYRAGRQFAAIWFDISASLQDCKLSTTSRGVFRGILVIWSYFGVDVRRMVGGDRPIASAATTISTFRLFGSCGGLGRGMAGVSNKKYRDGAIPARRACLRLLAIPVSRVALLGTSSTVLGFGQMRWWARAADGVGSVLVLASQAGESTDE